MALYGTTLSPDDPLESDPSSAASGKSLGEAPPQTICTGVLSIQALQAFPCITGGELMKWTSRQTLVEHLTIRADDCPGIVSEGIVEEPVRSREHAPRTLGPITRAFCVHPTYLENLSTMC